MSSLCCLILGNIDSPGGAFVKRPGRGVSRLKLNIEDLVVVTAFTSYKGQVLMTSPIGLEAAFT